MPPTVHLRDDELMLAIDGELQGERAHEVEAHLAHCWKCRARRTGLEQAIARFVDLHNSLYSPPLPPQEGPTARLRASLNRLESERRTSPFAFARPLWLRYVLPACLGAVAVAVSISSLTWLPNQRASAGPLPDSRLTPGATRSISQREVCIQPPDDDRAVPVELAHRVFEQYRIAAPQPRTVEVDYLISPTLGGADDIRNLWPQPYASGVWTSRVKDALEDYLHRLVCEGSLDLAEAQAEIASNWIAAYKRRFHTDRPLAAHAIFVKDRPWE